MSIHLPTLRMNAGVWERSIPAKKIKIGALDYLFGRSPDDPWPAATKVLPLCRNFSIEVLAPARRLQPSNSSGLAEEKVSRQFFPAVWATHVCMIQQRLLFL